MLTGLEQLGSILGRILRKGVLVAVGNAHAHAVVVVVAKESGERAISVGRHALELWNHRRTPALVRGGIEEGQERIDARVQAVVLTEQAAEVLDAADVLVAVMLDDDRSAGV